MLPTACGSLIGIGDLRVDPFGEAGADASAGSACRSFGGGQASSVDAGASTFCDDFGDETLRGEWRIETKGAGGTGSLDDTIFSGGPRGLTVQVTPNGELSEWALVRTFARAGSPVVLGFDVRLADQESATMALAAIGIAETTLELSVRDRALYLVQRGATGAELLARRLNESLSSMTWGHIDVAVFRGGTPPAAAAADVERPRVEVRLNGSPLSDPVEISGDLRGLPLVRVGILRAASPSGQRVVHFDNVTVGLD